MECSAIGDPVRFISANGPRPIRNASRATASIWAVEPTPSSSSLQASFSQGTKKRLTTKPGLSLQTMTTLPMALQYCSTAARVSDEVVLAGMTSISLFLAGW